MSYKKMSKINHKALNQEDAYIMIKCAALIKKLLEKSIECIFVDDFQSMQGEISSTDGQREVASLCSLHFHAYFVEVS